MHNTNTWYIKYNKTICMCLCMYKQCYTQLSTVVPYTLMCTMYIHNGTCIYILYVRMYKEWYILSGLYMHMHVYTHTCTLYM